MQIVIDRYNISMSLHAKKSNMCVVVQATTNKDVRLRIRDLSSLIGVGSRRM